MLGPVVLVVAILIAVITAGASYMALRREDEQEAQTHKDEQGLPPSLYPRIDLEMCIGSTGCIEVCPETLLRANQGVTYIHAPGDCVGHGRCQVACPVDAIKLVFGTAERGVDLPSLRAGYETNVDGMFIAGELGGMGLIRNAMRQGLKAVGSVPRALARPDVAKVDDPDLVDVVIVGAGPAGLAAATQCTADGISYTLLEQYVLGGSVAHYPRRKLVFSEQTKLPLVGRIGKREMRKEELMEEFLRIQATAGLTIQEGRRVVGIEGRAGDFRVICEHGQERETWRGRTVVLAIGRRGTPRPLDVPGEDLPHVVYRLGDADQYAGRRVLCVGGGDSAVEAAVALAEIPTCIAHLSYRQKSFSRAKSKNQEALRRATQQGHLALHLETEVQEVRPDSVVLRHANGRLETLMIDDVIVNVGGVLPTAFLESIGVEIKTRYGEAM